MKLVDGAPAESGEVAKPKKEKKPKEKKAPKEKKPQGGGGGKETKLGLRAKKLEEFGDWYSQVCVESEMISYYEGVSGVPRLIAAAAAPPLAAPPAIARAPAAACFRRNKSSH
jgi:hypothetical protein